MRYLALAVAALFAQAVCALRRTPNITLDDWSSVKLFENYTCAKLKVPLDYDNPSVGTTAIAFIKLSATNVAEDTCSLLINPGGPGGSGIDAVLSQGVDLIQIVQGQHNIVGFDPRGVGRSGPVVDCSPDYPKGRAQFEQMYYSDISNASSTPTGTQCAAAELFGKACTPTVGGSNGTAAYVSTPAVARDMLSYLQAEQAVTGRNGTKLWYYGLSYGTVFGATFAHLFPYYVGRMVLDGVVDAEDYYDLGWKSNLYDADGAISSLIQSCFNAGQANCSFWGASVSAIRGRLEKLLHDLKYQPIPIAPSDLCPLPMLSTYSDLKQVILQAMYSPLEGFPNLATVLSELEQGNTTAYSAAVTSGATPASLCNYAINGTTSTQDINSLIKCVDGAGASNFSNFVEFEEYVAILNEQSKFFGDVWPNNANGVACRFFNVSTLKTGGIPGSILKARHTANPILFVTTEIDPVAPKRVFPGSVVFTQNSVGHTAFASASTCLIQRIQTYILHVTLPPANTTCEPDVQPFQATSNISF
ncbi:hypothetical protein BJX66DRAFT_326213 [Aspergillus keveii]|uniref:Uncharacterized protein n=1 Tax=Aspergillus keveii TaxID=714993 RepID=A0ABR4G376_9EURO